MMSPQMRNQRFFEGSDESAQQFQVLLLWHIHTYSRHFFKFRLIDESYLPKAEFASLSWGFNVFQEMLLKNGSLGHIFM